jgi:hypothetical protein
MAKTSWFKFIGEILPKDEIPQGKAGYSLNRAMGSVSVNVDGANITVDFVTNYELFEDVFDETVEFVQSFLSVQSLKTGLPLSFVVHEWIETPLDPVGADGVSHPIRGRVYRENHGTQLISADIFKFALAEGIRWAEDMDWNPFLKRAMLDFNFALQHPINDVPIYLYRSIESAQIYFGGEAALIESLDVKDQVKIVKRLADDAQSGLHVRHAARTPKVRNLSTEEVMKEVDATRDILIKFQMDTWSRRIREGATDKHD